MYDGHAKTIIDTASVFEKTLRNKNKVLIGAKLSVNKERDRQTDRQTDKQTNRQTDKQTNRQKDKKYN